MGSGRSMHILVWDGESVKELYSLPGGYRGFSADGKKLFTMNDGKAHIWAAVSGEELHVLPGESRGITPDGKPITVMADNTIRIWDLSMVVE